MTTLANEAADIITGTYGALTITYRRLTYTWTITVYAGTLRIEELCNAYDNKVAAWREAQRIALAAHQGQTVWQIIDAKPSELVLAEAKRIIDGVNANMDRVQADRDATGTIEDARQIVGDGQGWNAYRQSLTRKPAVTTEPMDRVLASAVDGYVPRSKDARSDQLVALKARGLVELVYGRRGNQRVITGGQLTAKAFKQASIKTGIAA